MSQSFYIYIYCWFVSKVNFFHISVKVYKYIYSSNLLLIKLVYVVSDYDAKSIIYVTSSGGILNLMTFSLATVTATATVSIHVDF